MHDRKVSHVLNFEDVLAQYEPMISANIRQLNIYREHEQYRQAGRVALWLAWTRFDDEKGDFTPFAYRSIRGAMLDELKRESRFEENVMPTTDDVLVYFIGGAAGDDGFECLHDAIEQLDSSEKVFIQWVYLEGCSMAECAERFGISVAGVKKRRERMMKKLRGLMGV
ncbi:sigma-70 family RNA polymerase sigma factor [Sporosarcina koreensis]|uniref:sigma-70 family RNA polymerase sigma factor n=1 Tax=Sporosarcina koreensis TaxID=334735 RepID=UPI001F29350D|nr:sigma-70 family RNA polymerase sigma factor [Sporosarcina koreensis]